MGKRTILLSATLVLGLGVSVSATVLRVPSQYPTIQEGIDAALEGDTVLVADGTYTGDGNRDIDFGGIDMVVMSENGAETTIIDCEGDSLAPHRGFHFHSGEDFTSVVEGFTITHGWSESDAGGILCEQSSSPTIRGNTITENTVEQGYAGGIGCDYTSSPSIVGNTITKNVNHPLVLPCAGGISCSGSTIVEGNTIADNETYGINCGSGAVIRGNVITRNTGGGVSCWGSSHTGEPTIEGNTITANTATWGGGICCWNRPLVSGNEYDGIRQNCSPTIEGNAIAENTATYGGGIRCGHGSPIIRGNTITENRAGVSGGGIYCASSTPTVINSILWGDSAGVGREIYLSDSSITVTYSDVEGGWVGEGNIDEDPVFVLSEKGDYRLLWGSPCVDVGHPDSLDPDGTRSDMGAYFFNQDDYMTIYLTPDVPELSPGGELGVTYTVINRWGQPKSFWVLTKATLPNGNPLTIMGPDRYTLPADFTVQRHLSHDVPASAPLGLYVYRSRIGVPPSTLYDEDRFAFWLVEPE